MYSSFNFCRFETFQKKKLMRKEKESSLDSYLPVAIPSLWAILSSMIEPYTQCFHPHFPSSLGPFLQASAPGTALVEALMASMLATPRAAFYTAGHSLFSRYSCLSALETPSGCPYLSVLFFFIFFACSFALSNL